MADALKNSEHDFAFLPEGKPARLLRFKSLPDHHTLSILDVKHNILYINPTEYGRLPEAEQMKLDRTHLITTRVIDADERVTFVDDMLYGKPKPAAANDEVIFTFTL